MSSSTHVTQILQKQEEEPANLELVMHKLSKILNRKWQLREFISLCQAIEDRFDAQSKWHERTVRAITEYFGIARSTFYRKYKLYLDNGLEAIIPKKRGPKGPRLDHQIQDRIHDLRDLGLSAKSISTMISVEKQQKLSSSTTHYFLKKVGRQRLQRNRKPNKPHYKRFERAKPNELWQIDTVGPFYKPHKLFAFNVVDEHSRFCLSSKISDVQTTQSWIELLEQLVKQIWHTRSHIT